MGSPVSYGRIRSPAPLGPQGSDPGRRKLPGQADPPGAFAGQPSQGGLVVDIDRWADCMGPPGQQRDGPGIVDFQPERGVGNKWSSYRFKQIPRSAT